MVACIPLHSLSRKSVKACRCNAVCTEAAWQAGESAAGWAAGRRRLSSGRRCSHPARGGLGPLPATRWVDRRTRRAAGPPAVRSGACGAGPSAAEPAESGLCGSRWGPAGQLQPPGHPRRADCTHRLHHPPALDSHGFLLHRGVIGVVCDGHDCPQSPPGRPMRAPAATPRWRRPPLPGVVLPSFPRLIVVRYVAG